MSQESPPKQARPPARRGGIIPHTETGLERIVFFSDAVMAIAITLLALEIRLPEALLAEDLPRALAELTPRYASFLISFFVIGLFWLSHHRMFEYVQAYDRNLLWLNLVFLFLVVFVPFPTTVVGRFPAVFTSVALYAGVMVALSLARLACWWYVYYRAHLIRPGVDPRAGRYELSRALWTGGVFAVSIVIALWSPGWAMNFWILLLPISLLTRPPE